MEMKQLSSEYSLTDSEENVVGIARVEKNGEDASLELSLGDKLKFGSKEEVASFLNQILTIME